MTAKRDADLIRRYAGPLQRMADDKAAMARLAAAGMPNLADTINRLLRRARGDA